MDKYSNIIVLRSVFGANGAYALIQPCVDPKTGRFPDHIKKVDAHGDMILKDEERNSDRIFFPETEVFKIETGTTYNLDDPWDAAVWEAIRFSPLIAESRDARDSRGRYVIDGDGTEEGYVHNEKNDRRARYGVAEYYVDRPGEEQNRKLSRAKKVHQAKMYIFDDPRETEGRKTKCKILGKNMTYQTGADALEYLLKIAESDPDKIINLYTGSDTNLRLLFVEALERGVIAYKNSLYMFNDTILGASNDSVITWMKESRNKNLLNMIKKETLPEVFQAETAEDEIAVQEAEEELEEKKTTRAVKSTTAKTATTKTTTTKTAASTATEKK